jgi:hypothetical protein
MLFLTLVRNNLKLASAMFWQQWRYCGQNPKRSKFVRNVGILQYHIILHQETVREKSVSFTHVMKDIVTILNFIRPRGLNHTEFQNFLKDMEKDYGDVVYTDSLA